MPYRDLRAFLAAVREHDRVVEVDRPVDLHLEVGRALKKAYAAGGPTVIFRQNGTSFPLVSGLYSTRPKALLAFEATEETIVDKVHRGMSRPIDPRVTDLSEPPVHEVVLTGGEIDLGALPIPQYSERDGGRYITPGIVVSRDVEFDVFDLGHYRFQVMGKDTLSFLAQPFHRFGKNMQKAKDRGASFFEAAIVIGCDPVLAYTCQAQVPDSTDDYALAGGLRGEAVELVRCKTIDVMVPATAECVIEMRVDFGQTVMEGPLGEYTGYYTPASPKPIAKVTAVTHRKDAYFQALLTGKPVTENHILKEIPFEASLYASLKGRFPTLTKVAIPPSGGVSFYVVLQMTPRYAGEARHAILASMSSNIRPKYVVVVNTDIDVFSSSEIEWALSFRTRPESDVLVVGQLPAGPLDPSVPETGTLAARLSSAVGIDATLPFGEEFPEVADVANWQSVPFPELDD